MWYRLEDVRFGSKPDSLCVAGMWFGVVSTWFLVGSPFALIRRRTPLAHFHVETSHCHIAMTSSKYFGIKGRQGYPILPHDIESLSHDNKPFPHGYDSFPYRFNRATIGFRPSTIAFALKTSHLKALRYCSAPDSGSSVLSWYDLVQTSIRKILGR